MPRSITSAELVEIVRPIVQSEMPEETVAFDLSAADVAARILANSTDEKNTNPAHFEFISAGEASNVLEFVKLLSATFTFVTTVVAWVDAHKKTNPELAKEWTKRLTQAGLPEAKAARISERFLGDLVAKRAGKSHAAQY